MSSRGDAGSRFVEFKKEETEQSVPARFEKQVAKYPDHLAVKTKLHQLTYAALNRSANFVAHAIRQQSGNDDNVGLLLEQDARAIIAIFAALKAGKIFVPLDPSLPHSRIKYILNDSGARVIITNSQSLGLAQDLSDGSHSCIDIDRLDTSLAPNNLGIALSPDSISCILYTSGSTGQPKGVLHTHRNELHSIKHHTNYLHLSADDRFSLLAPYGTGQGIQDIFSALLNGGTLCPWSIKSEGLNGLAEWLIQEGITVYHSAATVFRHFVRNLSGREEFPELRVIKLGSEQVSWKDIEAYKKHFSRHCILVNALSSSETKTIRQYVINKETQIESRVPVGYSVEGMEVLILDESGNELVFNQVGEIAVRSRYLSTGYWHKPDLTSAVFLLDPTCPDNRLYRTGEWGRMSSDGCLEHLGRKDAQVKIQGYRIEISEIELALLQHPAVEEAVVTCRESTNGEKYLAAYIILNLNHRPPPTVSELRVFLRERIPHYMVPSAFVFLESLPLTPNGKIDRHALPEPTAARPVLDVPFVPPKGPIEEVLVNIGAEILGIDELGVHDNLFDVGGNSLLAVQIVARVEKTFRVEASLKSFFESPTIASLSQNISTLLGLIESPKASPMEPAARNESLPLSFSQQRLWFLDQWEPGNAVYTICRAYHLRGPLDVGAMEESVNGVVQCHEVLRTTFSAVDGQPAQIIAPVLRLPLSVIDLRSSPEAKRNEESMRLAHEEARRPFDLAHGPLLRATLIKLAKEEHLILFVLHQIVCDGWSMQVFLREFWTLYESFCEKRPRSLPVLPFQYADFTVWQRRSLQDDALQPALSYWKKQLVKGLPPLNLPTDRPKPALQSFKGARHSLVLPEPLTLALRQLSRREGVTLFMTLMAAFKALLSRYTGEEDVTVGFPIANRDAAGTSDLIGLFVNTLVLRSELSGTQTFKELLIRVRDVCLGAYAHRNLPFEKLVEELQPERDVSRNPLFQVMFAFQNRISPTFNFPGLAVEAIDIESSTAKLDLTLSLTEQHGELGGFFEYNTDLFDRSTIDRMAGHFQSLLQGIVANPDQSLSTLPLLTDDERHQLLVEWNDTETEYPKDSCIHELFEAQVESSPNAIAVESEGKRLSYRELNGLANQLAHYLQGLGIGPESLVGICIERSLDVVVGLLGILKAGGAYVPLDPSYPRERLAFMLEDSQVSVLLTSERIIEGFKVGERDSQSSILDHRMKLVCFDTNWETIDRESAQNIRSKVKPDNLAYVIYTSGSTGTPKGVQISHGSLVNCVDSLRRQLEVTAQETFLALASISYDLAGSELYLPLIAGARVVLANREEVLDGRQLQRRLIECGATAMHGTSSSWRLLLDAGWRGSRNFKILCGGDTLSRQLADQLLEGGASVWNLYGPTETTIWSTIARAESGEIPVLIGRPIANTKVYILDSHLEPVPVGVHGELYIGGDGLARGYLNRPEVTAERFVLNPFNDQTGSRLYRTGDLARYRFDGNIEFLGRVDNQAKIRGYRVEPGEIESILSQHPGVKETVVVLREHDSAGDKDLLAYFVPRQDLSPSVIDLRRFLREKVPEYMMPAIFIAIDALPLSPNGKVDRSQLPPPDDSRRSLKQGVVEPRSEIEELVAQVWREVLKAERVGVYDNFFDLGGHSLVAVRVIARLRNDFNVDLPLRKLFELPTVADLAEHIDLLRRNKKGVSVPAIIPIGHDDPLPVSFSQRRLWFLHKLDPRLTAYNIPARFRITGTLSAPALEKALNEIIKRHEVLRTRIIEIDGQPLQEILPKAAIELRVADLSDVPQGDAELQRELADDARQPYNLAEAPLMRAKLLRLREDDYFLILNFHHIVCDGSSLVLFYRELATLYEAFLDGKDFTLPSLPVQYADYAVWQHEGLQGKILESQLAYWKRQLGGGLATLNLPMDSERPVMQSYRGARLSRTLSEELTKVLKELSRREGVTLFMTLLAVLNILLSRLAGQNDIVVGSTIAGRNRPEIDGLIGFFINALALRTDLSDNPTFVDLLKRVREICLDAYTHQDLPFERVVEEINPQRDLSRNPLFQLMFNMTDASERLLKLTGCQTIKISHAAPGAKFDIILHAPEIEGKLELAIVYNADLFTEGRISSLLEQFSDLLAQVVESPGLRIDQYSLVSPSARAVLPDPTESLDDTWEGAIHELFSKQANRAPDCLAVVDTNESWTYRELDRQSNQLANYLVAGGIQPKDRVAIYAHRSAHLVLALLGVLKAGATFVIVDPAYPAERLINYLRIAQPKGWLQMAAAGELPEGLAAFIDSLEISCGFTLPRTKNQIAELLSQFPENQTGVSVNADDPAYIAFTSGSTGQPKGVLCRHGPITHFLPWQKETFDLRETDRFSLLSGLAYNHLHRDIFTALWLGATVYVPAPGIVKSPDQLTEWLLNNEITILHLTPASGRLLHTARRKTLSSIRAISFAGDVLTQRDVRLTREIAPNANISNRYGATETQRAVSYYEIPRDLSSSETKENRIVPLGRGAKDVQLLLLNRSGQIAGIGELADLYVRSPHLASGYIGDERLTQELFVTNPFTNDPDDRLYRTGELGRYFPDGNVEWAGRNDRRVNIRGFRVELEEIESVLKRHPTVATAAVVLQDYEISSPENLKPETRNPKPDQRLVAYVVPDLDQPLSIDELRCFLNTRLPDYMVPSHFLILGRLPLTPNGKVNYELLLSAEQSRTGPTEWFVGPRNDLEANLCKIFSQVLGKEQVGVNDNFFHLGGHSLLAAQASIRVKQACGVALEFRTFLESPTVEDLARHIGSLTAAGQTTTLSCQEEREEIEI
jgi:amino acid adenylation domain-containing protein